MNSPKIFSSVQLAALDKAKILGVRSGDEHKYTGVWVVVIDGRAYVRSWNDKPTGWYRAFLKEPFGSMQLDKKDVPIRAKRIRSEKILAAVSDAYALKYNTKASQKWVIGFAEAQRAVNTFELVPA